MNMDKNELKYCITELVDNELKNNLLKEEVLSLINKDADAKREYELQRFMKSLVNSRCKFQSAPSALQQKIIKKIKPRELNSISLIDKIHQVLWNPAAAFTAAIIVIVLAVFFINNKNSTQETYDLLSEQAGTDNMFIQAGANFENINNGKLAPQIISNNPEEIRHFFLENGVKYSALIPEMKDWKILGAVVSEGAGEKFAHHVYTNQKGELIYIYQADKSYINHCEAIKLSQHLIDYLEKGNCFSNSSKKCFTLMKKIGNNIFAIVSNAPKEEIEKLFCSN